MDQFSKEELEEIKLVYPNVSITEEGGLPYILIEGLPLPDGCAPAVCDVLFCPAPQDGYNSRLYLSEKVASPIGRNWNKEGFRVLERGWNAYSWKIDIGGLRLMQLLTMHLEALVKEP